mgnify:FL=1
MDLYHLEYIVEIGKTGNISKAAENLHISQPTLSIYLNKLERSLAVPLFIRKKNLLVPTEAGEKYVDACRRILSIRDELYQDLFSKNQTELRLGVLRTSLQIFNEAIQGMKSTFPQLLLLPKIFSSEQIYQELLAGNIDLGCATSYHPNIQSDFPKADYTCIRSYELVLMISRHNPAFSSLVIRDGCLAEESYPVLEQLPIFRGKNGMVQKRMVEDIFPRLNIRPKWREGLNDIEFMFQTLVMENSYAILPFSRIQGGDIEQIHFSFHPKIQRIFLYPPRHYLNPPERDLIQRVSAAYEHIPFYYDVSL